MNLPHCTVLLKYGIAAVEKGGVSSSDTSDSNSHCASVIGGTMSDRSALGSHPTDATAGRAVEKDEARHPVTLDDAAVEREPSGQRRTSGNQSIPVV